MGAWRKNLEIERYPSTMTTADWYQTTTAQNPIGYQEFLSLQPMFPPQHFVNPSPRPLIANWVEAQNV